MHLFAHVTHVFTQYPWWSCSSWANPSWMLKRGGMCLCLFPSSCLESPWFQQACGYPCGFVPAWSALHSPLLMLVCASGIVRVEQDLVAWVCHSLQIWWDHQSLEFITTLGYCHTLLSHCLCRKLSMCCLLSKTFSCTMCFICLSKFNTTFLNNFYRV